MCLNCNAGNASYAALDKRSRCKLCGRDLTHEIGQRRMLIATTESKIDEILDLLSAYQRLRTLNSPTRTSLLLRAQGALQAMLALEGEDLPPHDGDGKCEVLRDERDADEEEDDLEPA